jgi:general secretion pathway protein L
VQQTAIVRLVEDRLAWYPPGTDAEPQWLDNDIAAENLRSALARRQLGVCFAVPGADVSLLTLPVTAAEKKHIGKSLPFILEEQVAADIDDLHFAYSSLGVDRVAVAVCSEPNMHYWQSLLAPFPGINQWLPEPLLLPWQEGEWCLVCEGDSVIVRVDECEGFTIEKDLVDALLHGVLAEAAEPQAIIVYGSDQAADLELLPAAFHDRVQWRNGGLYAAMMLREGAGVSLNVLQGEFAPRLPFGRWWRQWRAVAALFVGAFVLQLAGTYSDYRNLSAENLELRSAVEQSYRKAYPKGAVVDAEKQLRRKLDALQGTSQTGGFVGLLDRVGVVISDMPGTSIASINYNNKGDEMRMNIVAKDFEGVEKLRSRINEAGLQAIMESSNAQGDKVRARLRVAVKS